MYGSDPGGDSGDVDDGEIGKTNLFIFSEANYEVCRADGGDGSGP
jgi:hypothetical protein